MKDKRNIMNKWALCSILQSTTGTSVIFPLYYPLLSACFILQTSTHHTGKRWVNAAKSKSALRKYMYDWTLCIVKKV